MTTIYDIAKKANVSPMTVSRVINNKRNISEKTRKKVEDAIKELNYIPNSAARSLNVKKTKLLSLIIPDITNPFFTQVARGAADKAHQLGYQLMLFNTDEDPFKESNYIDALISKMTDGVVIAPTGNKSKKNLTKLIKNKVPFILLDRRIEDISCDMVLGNNHEGTKELVQHLIDQGHKRIAMIHAPFDISTSKERFQAYMETLKVNDIAYDEKLVIQAHYKHEENWDIINNLIQLPSQRRPTAIFAANNFIAINIISTLRKNNIHVPRDIAVVCFDDLEPYTNIDPFFTVASQPAYDFGYLGTQLVIERIEEKGPSEYRIINLQPKLIVRKSSINTILQ